MADILWNCEEPIRNVALEAEVSVPRWIDQDITPADVAAIVQGGCASGAYMPAVTYWEALQTMSRHGDEIFTFLETTDGCLPVLNLYESWAGLACFFVSTAVEAWAFQVEPILSDILEQQRTTP